MPAYELMLSEALISCGDQSLPFCHVGVIYAFINNNDSEWNSEVREIIVKQVTFLWIFSVYEHLGGLTKIGKTNVDSHFLQ